MKMLLVIFSFFVIIACKSEKQERIEKAAEEMEKAAEQLAEAAEKMSEQIAGTMEENAENMADAMEKMGESFAGDTDIESVEPAVLKNLLPTSVADLKRQDVSSERTKSMGFQLSHAEADYYGEPADGSIFIEITDMGNMSGFLKMGSATWAMTEYERESAAGFERTTKIAGHKALEEYDNDFKRGKINIIVAGRFLIEIRGRRVEFKLLQEAVDKINLTELVDLAEDAKIN